MGSTDAARRGGRGRWLALFTLLLCIASVAAVSVASTAEGAGESPSSAEAPPPSGSELAVLELEEREHAEWLSSPEAARQREASRDAFADLSSPEAQNLLVEAFPKQLQELNADPARVLSELEVEKALGTYGARIAEEGGESAIVESSVPVESDLGGKGKEPVNLALEPSGSDFVPQNPLSEVELPGSAEEPIRLQSGVGVELPTSDDHSAEPLGDKNLFYPETNTATDTLVSPIAGGVEVFEQLRSSESPEQFSFKLSLPAGASLRASESGGAEVVSSSGSQIEEVPPPLAVDAQGAAVPVKTSVEGDSLLLEVPHRSREVAYPLLLDPRYNEGFESPPFLSDWAPLQTGGYSLARSSSSLAAISQGNNFTYGANTWGQWEYTAPGETTYIEKAIFSSIYFIPHTCQTSQPHGYLGIYNVFSGSYNSLGLYSGGESYSPSFDTGYVGGVGTRKATVGIGTGGSSSKLSCAHEIYVGGVAVQENDPEKPTINSVSGVPSGWLDPAKAGSATVVATDPGFGVDDITMSESGGVTSEDRVGCTGMSGSRCPRERGWTINPPYKEGERTLLVTAEDPTGKSKEWTTTTKVDPTKPEVTLGGQLAVETDEAGSQEIEQSKGKDGLSLPVYNLHIEATDGSNSSPQQKQSGVVAIGVSLDENTQPQELWQQSCPNSSCSMSENYALKLNNLTAGTHTLYVDATDGVGFVRERKIEFEYIPATGMKEDYVLQRFPLPDGEGNEAEEEHPDRPELAVNVMNGNLVYRQKDVEVKGPNVNLEIERFYNSQLPKSDGTEWGRGWTLAQTPKLEPEATKGSEAPKKATMLRASGALESSVGLPTESGGTKFDPALHAVITKEAGGGYVVADESGETDNTLALDSSGKVTELRTPGYSKVDYDYEAGKLSEIAVEDPASTTQPPQAFESSSQLPSNLVAALSFDEGSGSIAHDSAHGHDATIHGAKWTKEGKYGSALEFNGESDYLSIPDSSELGLTKAFTLEAWVKPSDVRTNAPLIEKQTKEFYAYQLYAGSKYTAGVPEGRTSEADWASEAVTAKEALPTNTWSHVALTYDGEKIRIYVNGKLISTAAGGKVQTSSGALWIGGNQFSHYFKGTIDEVRLYNQALSEGQVGKDTETAIGLWPEPVAALSFDEGSGSIAHDSAHGHDATIHGAKWTKEGKYGSALEFNGESDYLSIPDSSELGLTKAFTLEAWVKPSDVRTNAPLIEKQTKEFYAYQLYAGSKYTAGVPEGRTSEADWASEAVTAKEALPTNTWSHVALTYDGEKIRIYVNGKLISTAAGGKVQTSSGALWIGGNQFSHYFKGTIDEVRLYNQALSEGQVGKDTETAIGLPPALVHDDPAVEISTVSGLVTSVEGKEVGQHTYAHAGQLLTAADGSQGETKYEYDSVERLKKVTLPNGTWGEIGYETLGRVKSVTVSIEGGKSKTTHFEYSDEPRRTVVTPEAERATTYDIGADGSVLKWWNALQAPEIEELTGSLYAQRGEIHPEPISIGDQTLHVHGHSDEGIASIEIVANNDQLVTEKTCEQDFEKPGIECVNLEKEMVTNTANWPPGTLQLEAIVTDRLGQTSSERLWDNIPYTPPPGSEAPEPPKFEDILRFREEFGLDLDLKGNEQAINERVFELIADWHNPNAYLGEVARASAERWGVPLRPVDVAELEYREAYIEHDGAAIEEWAETHAVTSYAGYYVNHAAGGIINVGFTGSQEAHLTELKAQVNLMAPGRLASFPAVPPHSQASLQSIMESVEGIADANQSFANVLVDFGIDETGNVVEVGATNVETASSILHATIGASAPISVSFEEPIELETDRNHSTGRVFAGDRIIAKVLPPDTRECTAGFGAWEDITQKSTGAPIRARFLLTAGHCFPMGEEVKRSDRSDDLHPEDWTPIGTVNRTGLPLGGQHYETDAEGIRLGQPGFASHYIDTERFAFPIKGIAAPHHGQLLCVSGAISNKVDCGYMTGVRYVKTEFPGRQLLIVVHGLHTVKGDSGAPLWNPKTESAVGLLEGRSLTRQNVRFFTPLVKPRGFPAEKVPGALNAPGMGNLHIAAAP
jgi:YD repeat-containing protein